MKKTYSRIAALGALMLTATAATAAPGDTDEAIAVASTLTAQHPAAAEEEAEEEHTKFIEGEAFIEGNYQHAHGSETPVVWDFPHLMLSLRANFGRGWSWEANYEYERFYEDHSWHGKADFSGNFAAVYNYLQKEWKNGMAVQAGAVTLPVGITNGGGEALTIYDAESEEALIPMKWHEYGATYKWDLGRTAFSVTGMIYGAAGRVDFHATDDLRFGVSAFYGNTGHGSTKRHAPDFYAFDADGNDIHGGMALASVDFDYVRSGLTIDGSAIYASRGDAHSFGIEAGYNVLESTGCKVGITPYVRYDGIFNTNEAHKNKYTLALAIEPIEGLALKVEESWANQAAEFGRKNTHTLDVGLRYTFTF